MAGEDLTADSNTTIAVTPLAWNIVQGTATVRSLLVSITATADDNADYVDLNDVVPGGSVTVRGVVFETEDGVSVTGTTWSSDRVVFASNNGSAVHRVVVLAENT